MWNMRNTLSSCKEEDIPDRFCLRRTGTKAWKTFQTSPRPTPWSCTPSSRSWSSPSSGFRELCKSGLSLWAGDPIWLCSIQWTSRSARSWRTGGCRGWEGSSPSQPDWQWTWSFPFPDEGFCRVKHLKHFNSPNTPFCSYIKVIHISLYFIFKKFYYSDLSLWLMHLWIELNVYSAL